MDKYLIKLWLKQIKTPLMRSFFKRRILNLSMIFSYNDNWDNYYGLLLVKFLEIRTYG